ncbi:MAG TPA: hypothetical protein VKS24_08660 [Bradyrhizobium sp.]|nr:hypothetical protein [Bradyrhizobium sp.]
MALRNVFIVTVGVIVMTWSGLSAADEYRADEFLGLDLSRAVLSPKPLGPASGFTPGPLDVTVDRGSNRVQARSEPAVEPKVVVRNTRVVHQRAVPQRQLARTKLARQLRNPVDAQAFDARIQVWPCKSGGICNWKR